MCIIKRVKNRAPRWISKRRGSVHAFVLSKRLSERLSKRLSKRLSVRLATDLRRHIYTTTRSYDRFSLSDSYNQLINQSINRFLLSDSYNPRQPTRARVADRIGLVSGFFFCYCRHGATAI